MQEVPQEVRKMKIRIFCNEKELEKTEQIQEAMNESMKMLAENIFNGKISIEKE